MVEKTLYNNLTAGDAGAAGISDDFDGPLAQSFNSGTVAVQLDDLKLKLAEIGPPNAGQAITVSLLSNSAGDPGAVVATLGTLSESSLSSSPGTFNLAISSGPTLAANTTYWIELTSPASSDAGWEVASSTAGTGVAGQSDYFDGTNEGTVNPFIMALTGNTCFAAGTRILTARGEVPVEALRPGDHVMALRSGRLAKLRWIGHRHIETGTHPRPSEVHPIRIRAHAFADDQPRRDLILSPNHAILADGALIAARYLLNGATIVQEAWPRVHYYHVELDTHDILLADGLAAESYLDVGNRAAFTNAGGVTSLHPDLSAMSSDDIWAENACAPALDKGEPLEALRQRLLDRAGRLGHVRTSDPSLRVLAGGRAIAPAATPDGLRFDLPPNAGTVRLVSRSARPAEMRARRTDGRRLGIGVISIRLDDEAICLDDARLGSGWHEREPRLRWTDGDARLDADSARTLTLRLHPDMTYWDDRAAPPRARRSA